MTLRATLFDMDGLLLDSEILWHEAEVEIFGGLGVPLLGDDERSTKGMYVKDVAHYWYGLHPWTGSTPDEISQRLIARVGELVETKGRLMPGARRALDLTGEHGPLAIASSTPLALIIRCLQHFDLVDRFASIHSAEFEEYGKPHPGVFLSAAASLSVAPADCLVLEDSAAGVVAATAARMTVIAVPTSDDRARVEFLLADLVLDSLEELSPVWLDERFL